MKWKLINRRQYKEPHPIINNSKDYVYVIIGAAIIAIAFNVFLLPNQVASGGVSGISTILKEFLVGRLDLCNMPLIFHCL